MWGSENKQPGCQPFPSNLFEIGTGFVSVADIPGYLRLPGHGIPPIAVWMRIALIDRLVHLNAWHLGSWTVWESVALLEEIPHCGVSFEIPRAHPRPSMCLSLFLPVGLQIRTQDFSSRPACLPATMLPAMMNL